MRPWGSATRCVDSCGSCLPGARQGPAVRRSGRNTHGGRSPTAAGGRERARRPVGDTVSGCGCGAGGSGRGGGNFLLHHVGPLSHWLAHQWKHFCTSWDRGYTCPSCPNCQHPELPPWPALPTIITDCVMVSVRGSAPQGRARPLRCPQGLAWCQAGRGPPRETEPAPEQAVWGVSISVPEQVGLHSREQVVWGAFPDTP